MIQTATIDFTLIRLMKQRDFYANRVVCAQLFIVVNLGICATVLLHTVLYMPWGQGLVDLHLFGLSSFTMALVTLLLALAVAPFRNKWDRAHRYWYDRMRERQERIEAVRMISDGFLFEEQDQANQLYKQGQRT
jgi:hypothetical protein